MSAWISMISDSDAGADLLDALDQARAPQGGVGNVMRIHSHRPNTMRGHVALYNAALHDVANTLEPWLQEVLGSYVSHLNECPYSFTNHWSNARHLIGDDSRADGIEQAMRSRSLAGVLSGRELALMQYAEKLTLSPGKIDEADVIRLKELGLTDGEILEANQVIAYFCYVNRLLNGLGVTLEGDKIGYYSE